MLIKTNGLSTYLDNGYTIKLELIDGEDIELSGTYANGERMEDWDLIRFEVKHFRQVAELYATALKEWGLNG